MNGFNLFKQKTKKLICHVGAWAGNFGDSIIQQSIKNRLTELSKNELDFCYINCQQTEFTRERIEQINSKCDLMIIGGGGLVFYRPQDKSKSGWQWNIDINLINAIKIPFVVYGIGYNQFEYDTSNFIPITNSHLQKTVNNAALFSVRNSGTRRELITRGCDGSKIEVVSDSGMFATPKKITIPDIDKTKLKIGFNWTSDREDQTFPPPFKENRDKFIKACISLLNYAIVERNAQVFYISHMGNNFDRNIIVALKEKLISSPIVIEDVLSEIYPPSDGNAGFFVDIYRQMDIVLGMRGHSNIVSLGQNTPFVGLGSHRKIRYFLEDVGRSKYFFDVRPGKDLYSTEKMISILNNIIDNISSQRKTIKEEKEKHKRLFNKFNSKILSLMD